MRKYYSRNKKYKFKKNKYYKVFYTKKKYYKKNNFRKVFVIFLSLVNLVSIVTIIFYFVLYLKTIDLHSIIGINQISILKNETTIPSELVIKKFFEEKINIFNLNRVKHNIIRILPEIKNIEFKIRLINNCSSEIKKQEPVFVVDNKKQKIFYSANGAKFWVYDISKSNIDNLIELNIEKSVNAKFLTSFYKHIDITQKKYLIKKVYFKHNDEIIIETISGNKIIVDKNLINVEPELFAKTLEIAEKENVDIYGRNLEDGKLYIRKRN